MMNTYCKGKYNNVVLLNVIAQAYVACSWEQLWTLNINSYDKNSGIRWKYSEMYFC